MIKYPRRKEPQTHIEPKTNTNTANVQAALSLAEQKQAVKEKFGLCDPDWVYVPAAATDITKTWRKFGWKPLEEVGETE